MILESIDFALFSMVFEIIDFASFIMVLESIDFALVCFAFIMPNVDNEPFVFQYYRQMFPTKEGRDVM